MNQQPWTFAALTDPERIRSYGERAKQWLLASTGVDHPEARHLLEDPSFHLFYGASVLLLVIARSSVSQAIEDCCLAAENLMLAARDAGIGTCWIGFARPWLNLPATKTELGIPSEHTVVAPLIVGYPKAWPASHGRNAPEIRWL